MLTSCGVLGAVGGGSLITNSYLIFGLVMVLLVFVGAFAFRKDEKIEDKRRKAIKVSQEFTEQGLKHIPELLIDYAVGDLSGIIDRIKSWEVLMNDDDQRRAFFAKFRKTQIDYMLANDSDRSMLFAKVDAWKAIQSNNEAEFAKRLREREVVNASAAASFQSQAGVVATAVPIIAAPVAAPVAAK